MTAFLSMRARVACALLILALTPLTVSGALAAQAFGPGVAPPERAPVVMVGDRLVNIAYHLGVIPQAMSIRGDIWTFGRTLARTSSMILGCPNYIVRRDPDIVPRTLRETGIRRVLVEHTPGFDRHKPVRDPMNLIPLLETSGVADDLGVVVEVVDFTQGLEPAIRQIGALLDRTEAAEELIQARAAALQAAQARISGGLAGKRVVILNGVHQDATGKGFVRVELPGGYADDFLLEPLGLTNAGGGFVEAGATAKHGFAMANTLLPLKTIQPDVLVLTGDADAVLRKLARERRRDPAFATIPAIASGAVVALPAYYDSNVIEYPAVLGRWAVTLQAVTPGS